MISYCIGDGGDDDDDDEIFSSGAPCIALMAFENVDVTDIDDYGDGDNGDETFSSGSPCFDGTLKNSTRWCFQ